MHRPGFGTGASRQGPSLPALLAPLLPDTPAPGDGDLLAELSKVMGVADAIALHGLLRGTGSRTARPTPGVESDLADRVLAARQALREFIAHSFAPEPNQAPFSLPSLDEPPGYDGLTGPQRLQRFYSRHQQELEVRVQGVRQQVRQGLGRLSPALAQLAELDDRIGQVVSGQLGRALAAIPAGLARHCDQCRRQGEEADDPRWPVAVAELTRGLLLAELDLRLAPVFGLVEAVEESTGEQPC